MITEILTKESGSTGVYYDHGGKPMQGSMLVREPKFTGRVVSETSAFLSTISTKANCITRPRAI